MNNSGNGASTGQPQPQQPHIPAQPSGGGMQLPGMASAIEHYRLSQLYQYAMAAERLRCPPGSQPLPPFLPPLTHPGFRPELAPFLYSSYCRIDPRLALCRPPEEPKPQHSYIGLIAMAILGHPEKKLVLSDIYQYILDNYPYFRSRGPGWRNSIRHNLSLNDCFVKSGRSANGKGHYWAIHPANIDDFTKGDFRRRKAQRKVRRHMGLAVDDADSPSPPPASPPPVNWPDHHPHHPLLHAGHHRHLHHHPHFALNPHTALAIAAHPSSHGFEFANSLMNRRNQEILANSPLNLNFNPKERKRQFDVASLLAPEHEKGPLISVSPASTRKSFKSEDECENEQCFSRSPSPPSSPSPSCKSVKKLSPANSDEDQSEDEKHNLNRDRNSSDDDENDGRKSSESIISINKERINSPPTIESLSMFRPPHIEIQSLEVGTNPNSGSSNDNVNRAITTIPSSNLPMMKMMNNSFCQQHTDSILQHQLGVGSPVMQGGFAFNPNHPNHQNIFQHNPSLASLMFLSSRYREFATGMAAVNNKKSH